MAVCDLLHIPRVVKSETTSRVLRMARLRNGSEQSRFRAEDCTKKGGTSRRLRWRGKQRLRSARVAKPPACWCRSRSNGGPTTEEGSSDRGPATSGAGNGFVVSLARPGGKGTGFTMFEFGISLREMPRASHEWRSLANPNAIGDWCNLVDPPSFRIELTLVEVLEAG